LFYKDQRITEKLTVTLTDQANIAAGSKNSALCPEDYSVVYGCAWVFKI